MTVTLLALTGAAALADWAAVSRRLFRLEYLLKPLVLALLVAAVATADTGAGKSWLVAGLVLGLAGDVALLFSRDGETADAAFLAGLGAFLLGHVAYAVAFVRHGVHPLDLLAGVLVVAGAAALLLPQVLRGARRAGRSALRAVVAGYATLLCAMAVLAVGTGAVATAAGGVLFLVSDTVLAFERFVERIRRGPLLVIVTYHLAQVLIVLGLIRRF